MAVSSTLGLEVVITGVSKVVSELSKVDSAAGALGLVLKGVGKVGSGALKLLTAPLRAIGKVASLAWSGLSAVARSIWRIGEYVVGNLIARAVTAIGTAIWNMAKASVQAAADMQLMQVSIEGLLARELARGDLVIDTSTSIRHMTEAERLELDKLTLSYGELGVELSDAQQHYNDLAASEDAEADALLAADIAVRELTLEYQQMGAEMENLQGIEGSLVTTENERRINTMSMTAALDLLANEEVNRAEAMTKQLMMMALISPFQIAQTNETFRLAMAYGMGSEQAMEFTQAALDTAAGLGMTNVVMERFVYNLAQAVVGGDLTGINLRQLSLTSFNLAQVLRDELGLSIEEVREQLKSGQLTLEEVSDAFVHHAEVVWAGAAERARNTWTGFKNSLEDLNAVMGALIIEPALSAISEAAVPLFDAFTEVVGAGTFEIMGEQLGEAAERGLELLPVDNIVKAMPAGFETIVRLLEGDWKYAWWNALTAVQLIFGDAAAEKMKGYEEEYYAALEGIQALLEGDFATAWEKAKEVIIGVFGPKAKEPLEKFEKAVLAIYKAIKSVETLVKAFLSGDVTLADFVSDDMVKLGEAFGNVLVVISDWFREYGPDVKEAADEILTQFLEDVGLSGESVESLTGFLNDLSREIVANGPEIRDRLVEAMEDIAFYTKLAIAAMEGLIIIILSVAMTFGAMARAIRQVAEGDLTGALQTMASVFKTQVELAKGDITIMEVALGGLVETSLNTASDVGTNFVAMETAAAGSLAAMTIDVVRENAAMAGDTEEKTGEMVDSWITMGGRLVSNSIIPDMMADIVTAISGGLTDAVTTMGTFVSEFYDKGVELVQGLINGIRSRLEAVASAAAAIVRAAMGAARSEGGFGSPSQVMFEMGDDLVQGLIDGIMSRIEDAEDVVAELMEGLFDVAGAISGIGAGFIGLQEARYLDPLEERLEFIQASIDEYVADREAAEEELEEAERERIRAVGDEELAQIEEAHQARVEALEDTHDQWLAQAEEGYERQIAAINEQWDVEEERIKASYDLQEEEEKALFEERKRMMQQAFDDEEIAFKRQIDDEADAIRASYDEQRDLLDERLEGQFDTAEQHAERVAQLNAEETAALRELEDRERAGIRTIADREREALQVLTAQKENALDSLRQQEEQDIAAINELRRQAMQVVIDEWDRRMEQFEHSRQVSATLLTEELERQRQIVEDRIAEEMAAVDLWISRTQEEIDLERLRLDLVTAIAEEEERIAALRREQERFAFLQEQMDLLELIREYGLDPSAILGGMTLGLDADINDVIAAMTAAMRAIVQAINDELQITSPSGVFRDIGHQMMGGMMGGIADLTPAVTAQINAAVSPVMGGGGSITNNYYNTSQPAYNLTTQSTTQPGALALEFDAMEMASR